ncbi:MAG: serine hydrolase [Gammaproteobacteria bacterium]|nr:serine hydrolase [Gammaproteobacteria bacterium]
MTKSQFDSIVQKAGPGPVSRWFSLSVCLLLLLGASSGRALENEGISGTDVAALAGRAMSEFNVPGMAIGIIKAEKILLAEGYGIREIGETKPIDTRTLFKIASNSKAFTTAALATLVDDGLIAWDGLVIDYIPEFRMKDPWVTANFTVRDLLTHRSGLSPFKGDMLLWPEPNSFGVTDIIHALRYFEPVSSFRTRYAYDNLLYIVAGEIIPRVTGKTWGEFVESRIMRPAGMKKCFADQIPRRRMKNLATPHGVIEGELSVIERGRIPRQPPISAAAGGVICSLDDMLTWVGTQLNHGTSPDGIGLFSAGQSHEMWKPVTLRSVSERDLELNRTHFKAYGLGWRLADVHGFKEVSHTGTLAGMKSYVVMIPELDLGVVLLTNGSSSAARSAVMNTIVRSFMPVEQVDWIQLILDEQEAEEQASQKQVSQKQNGPGVETEQPARVTNGPCQASRFSRLTGRYRDPWFGDVVIALEDGQLVFSADRSPKLQGPLSHHEGNRFVIRWIDRSLEADAWIEFELDEDGPAHAISMSKLNGGDYDFEDLDLTRVE